MPTTSEVTVHYTSCQDGVVRCMTSCRYGYFLKASGNGGCPICQCLPRRIQCLIDKYVQSYEFICIYIYVCLTYNYIWVHIFVYFSNLYISEARRTIESSAIVTSKPNVYTILKNCPEAIHCMVNCKTGYALRTGPGSECPQCLCQTGLNLLWSCF